MHSPGGSVDFVVRPTEPEPFEQAARGVVRGVVSGEQGRDAERAERVIDGRACCLRREPATPRRRREMEPELVHVGRARPEATAPDELLRLEDGPVLDPVLALRRDLLVESSRNLLVREWSADERGHALVAPQGQREGQVVGSPTAEFESGRGGGVHRTHARGDTVNHMAIRAALVAVAAGAFWLGRAEADCAIDTYSVHLNLAATTPEDASWPAGVELTQLDDTTITW